MSSDLKIRRGQLISPYGVGAIVPFPNDQSFMVAGLDSWPRKEHPEKIDDDRLCRRLNVSNLFMPPEYIARNESKDSQRDTNLRIPLVRFPRWHYCQKCGKMEYVSQFKAGKLYCNGCNPDHSAKPGKSINGKLIPERFIIVCEDGHIDDFPLLQWVHNDPSMTPENTNLHDHIITRTTRGDTSALANIVYKCACGAKRSLSGAMNPVKILKIYPHCQGQTPWLNTSEKCTCKNPIKVVQRGGTNVWFSDTMSSISIPPNVAEKSRNLEELVNLLLQKGKSGSLYINGALNDDFIRIFAELYNESFIDLKEALLKRGKAQEIDYSDISEDSYRFQEYQILCKDSGADTQKFYCKAQDIGKFSDSFRKLFTKVSLVLKMVENRAFIGFSRLIPPDSNTSLNEKRKKLSRGNVRWLPAIQNSGEGIFIEFNYQSLSEWVKKDEIIHRIEKMQHNIEKSLKERGGCNTGINPLFVLIHTFSHILIKQLSEDCGYGSSSIRERLYVSFDNKNKLPEMCGVLLYTASGDAEGSLGGLVRQGKPEILENMIRVAIDRASWCSSDPICIESFGQGPDSLNLAACYDCCLLPETCCEKGNRFLDRGLLVGFSESPTAGYFDILKR